jgi:hypothetical protein
MKYIIFTICLILISGSINCLAENKPEKLQLHEIEIIDKRIDSIVNVVLERTEPYILHNTNIGIELTVQDAIVNLMIIFDAMDSFSYAYHEGGVNVTGFGIIQNHEVFFIGNYYPQLMKYSCNKRNFVFYKRKYKGNIPPPPPSSDPMMLEYVFKENGNIVRIR